MLKQDGCDDVPPGESFFSMMIYQQMYLLQQIHLQLMQAFLELLKLSVLHFHASDIIRQ